MPVVTFTATLVAGKIHLQQDSGGTAYTGSVLVTILNTAGQTTVQSLVSVTSGHTTTDYNFATSLNSSPNGTYFVSAIDRTSVNAGTASAGSHPTLTLTKTGSNAYSGAAYVAPYTWTAHTVTPATVEPTKQVTSHLAIAEGAHTFAIQIWSDFDSTPLFDGSVTTNSSGAVDVSYAIPYPLGTTFTSYVVQPNSLDSGVFADNTVEVHMSQPATGEGTGRVGEARYTLTNSTGRQWAVVGTGPDDATALAEANAKLALTVGTVLSSTQRIGIASGSLGAVHGATGDFEDAVITLAKTVNGLTVTRTVRLNNISTAFRLANSKGMIDGSNSAIAAFCSAYRDGDGLGGYAFQSGHYTK